MGFKSDLIPIVADVMKILQGKLRAELKRQGHELTGQLSDSIDYEVSGDETEVTGRMYADDYGTFVEFGVKAARIPFGGGGRGGGRSLYIQGLISFWEHRGLSGREAVGAAFATAHVHAREGMPTRNSRGFSATGERTGFVRTVIEENTIDIEKYISEKYTVAFELHLTQGLTQALGRYNNIKVI